MECNRPEWKRDATKSNGTEMEWNRWGVQQIGQEIGRGGFGTVFQALNTATGDFVAVKRMEMDSVKLDAGASIKVWKVYHPLREM